MQTEIFEKYFIEMITLPVEEVCFLKVLNKTFSFFFVIETSYPIM